MTRYRNNLPQMNGRQFLSDSGLETVMIFQEGFELPYFAAFTLLDTAKGRDALSRYFDRHIDIALSQKMGFILDTPTWRASADWGARLGLTDHDLDRINSASVDFIAAIRQRRETAETPMVLNGVLGPRGDGYHPDRLMTPAEAQGYHNAQIASFAATAADMVSAVTMTHVGEAIGIARAAKEAGLPAVISFTVETDGALPTGQALAEAVAETDAATSKSPAYYMVNCAHPSHFMDKLTPGAPWMQRIRGIRANASKRSHAELDEAQDLDDGNPMEMGAEYSKIQSLHPQVTVYGGCCGTDHRHIAEISAAVKRAA